MANQTTFEDFTTSGEAMDDPLGGLSFDDPEPSLLTTADSIENASRSVGDRGAKAEPLYWDLETIPDFSREHLFGLEPLPSPADESQLMTAEEFLSQDLKTVGEWFAKHTPPAKWIQAIRDSEQAAKKPRKGLFDALDEVESRTTDRIKTLSTNPFYCRIASAAWAVGSESPKSSYCGDDTLMEKSLIELLWRLIARAPQIIGYGIEFFDVPVLLVRSMILGVHPTKILDRRKYGSRDIFDLAQQLFNYQVPKGFGLGVVCKSLGIESACPDVDGSHVYDLFKAGKVAELRAYNEDDVRLCQRLHREKMAGYFCV